MKKRKSNVYEKTIKPKQDRDITETTYSSFLAAQKTHEKISKENLEKKHEKNPLFGIKKTPILKGFQEPIISFSAIIHSLKT